MHIKMDEKIVLNIGGVHFMTYQSTLLNLPGTKLAKLDRTDQSYDRVNNEYFFDRSPKMFEHILNYYRHGELHFPHCYCGPSIDNELHFWGLDENCISACCWRAYSAYEDEKKTVMELSKTLGEPSLVLNKEESGMSSKGSHANSEKLNNSLRFRVWRFLEKPQSSKQAKMWAIFIFFAITLSIAVVAMETHPSFRILKTDFQYNATNETNPRILMYRNSDLHPALVYLDGFCIVIFSLELIVRFIVCPSKLKFFKSVFNIIDIFCVVPLFAVYVVQLSLGELWSSGEFFAIIAYLSLSSVLRVFRLFKLARHYRGMRILQLAVRSSMKELLLLFLMISMGTLIFSTLIYFAEFNEDTMSFPNIPIGFWWSIITMTTVGYGDIYPTSGLGYIVGAFCAISGMLITGLPIPIIASNFNHYYNFARLTVKMANKPPPQLLWQGKSTPSQSSSASAHTLVSEQIKAGSTEGSSATADGSSTQQTGKSPSSTSSAFSDDTLCKSTLSTARLSSIGLSASMRDSGDGLKLGTMSDSTALVRDSRNTQHGLISTNHCSPIKGKGSTRNRVEPVQGSPKRFTRSDVALSISEI